jgi:hypothetical protein
VSSTPIQVPKPVNDPFPQAKHRGDGGAEDDLEVKHFLKFHSSISSFRK